MLSIVVLAEPARGGPAIGVKYARNDRRSAQCHARHCLENPGKIPLDLIEVRSGSYLEEDDIVRFADRYGRI